MMITDDYNVANPILEAYSYYPVGLQQKGIGLTQETATLHNKYTYNGKELLECFGLDQYDYGARFYDAQIGRCDVQDKYAEVYYSLAPYTYTGNNPVNAIELDGHLFIFASGFVPKQYV